MLSKKKNMKNELISAMFPWRDSSAPAGDIYLNPIG